MQRQWVALALALTLWTPAAAPPASVRIEVEYLLASIRNSGCLFFRNGTWYEGKAAEAHLRDKFDYLARHGRIASAEDFIEGAATASSLSGLSYAVKCPASEAVSSNRWLRDRLARHRVGDG